MPQLALEREVKRFEHEREKIRAVDILYEVHRPS
jgi:hypothetical protein